MDREVIGDNAGVVWNALNDSEQKLTLKGLKRASRLKDKELYAAMGWLSREDKISIEEIDGDLMIGLM